MIIGGRRSFILLFTGDMLAFVVALFLTLWLRYLGAPRGFILLRYIVPFAFLFVCWALIFYSAGLYSKRLLLFPSRLPDALFKTQLTNIIFAALLFFFIPVFGIAPKTILALYLIISLILIFLWRLRIFPLLLPRGPRDRATLLAYGAEADKLMNEVNGNPRYGIEFSARALGEEDTPLIVADATHLGDLSADGLTKEGKNLVAFDDLYEEVFDRVPVSKVEESWFRRRLVRDDPFWYVAAKRGIDLIGGVAMAVLTVLITPFVALALQMEYPGPVFISQMRIGQNGSRIRTYKFRSMRFGDRSVWQGEDENSVTRVGNFLRITSLDEFPQCVNILAGELSLIGPRNDLVSLAERLAEAIPYYNIRYSVKPGLTGWAQINQQYEPGNVSPQSIEETKVRLAYDFYYLKHRSFGLDIVIALKTVKRMFFRLSAW